MFLLEICLPDAVSNSLANVRGLLDNDAMELAETKRLLKDAVSVA